MSASKSKSGAKGTPTPHDLVFKQFLTHTNTARDFMQLHLPAELQSICDFNTLKLESGNFVEEDLRPYFSDVLYSLQTVTDNNAYIHVLIEPDGMSGMAGRLRERHDFHHRTLFTGHLNQLSRQQWLAGDVDFCRWNVHPTLSCLKKLTTMLSCQYFAPLFTPLDYPAQWQQELQCEIITSSTIEMELCQ